MAWTLIDPYPPARAQGASRSPTASVRGHGPTSPWLLGGARRRVAPYSPPDRPIHTCHLRVRVFDSLPAPDRQSFKCLSVWGVKGANLTVTALLDIAPSRHRLNRCRLLARTDVNVREHVRPARPLPRSRHLRPTAIDEQTPVDWHTSRCDCERAGSPARQILHMLQRSRRLASRRTSALRALSPSRLAPFAATGAAGSLASCAIMRAAAPSERSSTTLKMAYGVRGAIPT